MGDPTLVMAAKLPKPCSYCGKSNHYSINCFDKPRKPIRRESAKAYAHRQETNSAWLLANPPDKNGQWQCYLQISKLCLKFVDKKTLVHEHVRSKRRHPELKHVITNIKASCTACNKAKASQELEDLAKTYPHLQSVLDEIKGLHPISKHGL